ncbi:hypothetical protein LY76DRAFT_586288 [Colletotrichum caudatum]|nr:hypothetical protein LY76DRAFT_586288 [Colletotrichum caudatum]
MYLATLRRTNRLENCTKSQCRKVSQCHDVTVSSSRCRPPLFSHTGKQTGPGFPVVPVSVSPVPLSSG